MEDTVVVNVKIGGRPYRLNASVSDEGSVRQAANEINKLVEHYEKNAKHSDSQDLLAMTALHFAAKAIKIETDSVFIKEELEPRLSNIDNILTENIKD